MLLIIFSGLALARQLTCIALSYCVAALAATAASAASYQVFPQPNYATYLPQTVGSVLNDGRYVFGTMWTKAGGLAWRDVSRVSVTMDLGSEVPIAAAGFHGAARRAAGVEFPSSALIYLSRDGESFWYAGDAMVGVEPSVDGYQEKTFLLKEVRKGARYVRFEFFVRGRYLAMDEIEVVRGYPAEAITPDLAKGDIEKDAQRRAALVRDQQIAAREMVALSRIGAPAGKSPIESWSTMLAARFPGRELVLTNTSPWTVDLGRALPIGDENYERQIAMPAGGCDYRAFTLSNPSPTQVSVRLEQTIGSAHMKAQLWEVLPVVAATLDKVFDPLVAVGTVLPLKPGTTRILMLKLCGDGTHQLTVDSGRSKVVARTIVREVTAGQFSGQSSAPIAGVAWAYLDEGVLRGRNEAALSDLRSHYVNVSVVPPSALPAYDAKDFSAFSRMLAKRTDARRVILFLNFRQRPPKLADPAWREDFVQWYGRVLEAARGAGVDGKSVMLYPYDEPAGDEIPAAEAFYAWLRKAIPGVQLFATIDSPEALRLLPRLDISCITRKIAPQVSIQAEVWLYDVKGPGKANPPYAYYRLLPWEAYSRGMQGAGFWSYADISGSAWDDFDGRRPDYGVVYESQDAESLISSRRWEAWKMGMEDVMILKAYAERFGDAAVRSSVQYVLEMPGNAERADGVRQQLLRELKSKN